MNVSELSLRRPVLATVMNILIVLFGVIGFTYLGVRDYPAIDPPNVSVRANYPGANADIVESQITEPLEKRSTVLPAYAILPLPAAREPVILMWSLTWG